MKTEHLGVSLVWTSSWTPLIQQVTEWFEMKLDFMLMCKQANINFDSSLDKRVES